NADHPLRPHFVAERESVRVGVGLEDDLGDAVPITQVDEDAPAVISAHLDPTEEHDFPSDILGAKLPARMGSFELVDEACHLLTPRLGASPGPLMTPSKVGATGHSAASRRKVAEALARSSWRYRAA